MKYASDFRRTAREALRGNWILATLVTFVASLLGGLTANSSVSLNINREDLSGIVNDFGPAGIRLIISILFAVSLFCLVLGLVHFIIGGAISLGYARFSLNLIDYEPATFSNLFSQFNRLGDGFVMNLLLMLYSFLWSLLFVIPGIVKSFSYAMTPYILSEHSELTANEAITASRRMMDGNKFRLFCLNFSFIGWDFLTLLPLILSTSCVVLAVALGSVAFVIVSMLLTMLSLVVLIVGSWMVMVYRTTAQTAFYREISKHFFPEPTDPAGEASACEGSTLFAPAEAPKAEEKEIPYSAPAETPAAEAPESPAKVPNEGPSPESEN